MNRGKDSVLSALSGQPANHCRWWDRHVPTFSKLEVNLWVWEFSTVKTLTVDDHQRIQIPDAKPRQVFIYENHGDGHATLTLLTAAEPFPKGSLRQYLTEESNEELSALARCSSLQLPE